MNFKDYLMMILALLQIVLVITLTMVTIGLVLGIMYGLTKQLFLFGLKVMT